MVEDRPMPDDRDKRRGGAAMVIGIIAIAALVFVGYNLFYLASG